MSSAKDKAIEYLNVTEPAVYSIHDSGESFPVSWCISDKQLKLALDIAIKEAKKEVFDDIEEDIDEYNELLFTESDFRGLKKKHLGDNIDGENLINKGDKNE